MDDAKRKYQSVRELIRESKMKLRVAEAVDSPPRIERGSEIAKLEEFQDVQDIVAAVKQNRAALLQGGWKIFDLVGVHKRHPELKKTKRLMAAFANRVRDLMRKEGVYSRLRLEQRKDTFYLIGKE